MSLKVHNIGKDFYLKSDTLNALKNISFNAVKGDVIGIIGKNGSGKSTLLKILSGIYKPSAGSIEIEGNLLSILEVGTGFHPDLSGKENIYLNGKLLGLKDKKIDEIYHAIKDFSEIGDFINEPVKNYSSGMYFRLAFSIVAHMESDIILLDEVLSVGDESFRKKCLEKIKNDMAKDCIVLVASHDIRDLRAICNRGIFINKGEIITEGSFKEALNDYLKYLDSENREDKIFNLIDYSLKASNNKISIQDIRINEKIEKDTPRILRSDNLNISFELNKLVDEVLDVVLYIGDGLDLFMSDSPIYREQYNNEGQTKGKYLYKCQIPGGLLNTGVYDITIIIGDRKTKIAELQKIAKFRIIPDDWESDKNWNDESASIVVRKNLNWEVKSI